MAKKAVTLRIGMPEVILGSVEKLEVEITRNPEGKFQKSENRVVPIKEKSIEVKASPGTRLTVAVKCVDEKKQRSNTVVRHIMAAEPMVPELADEISCEVVEEG